MKLSNTGKVGIPAFSLPGGSQDMRGYPSGHGLQSWSLLTGLGAGDCGSALPQGILKELEASIHGLPDTTLDAGSCLTPL